MLHGLKDFKPCWAGYIARYGLVVRQEEHHNGKHTQHRRWLDFRLQRDREREQLLLQSTPSDLLLPTIPSPSFYHLPKVSANRKTIKWVSIHDPIPHKAPPAGNQASFIEKKRKMKHSFNNGLSYSVTYNVARWLRTEILESC